MSQFNPPPPPPPPPPFQPIPPTQPGVLGIPVRGTKWPMIIGVLAIVLGVFNSVCNVCGVFAPVLQDSLEKLLPAGAMSEAKTEERWVPWVAGASGIALLLGIMEIIGGGGLMKRAPWSPRILRTWAVLAIVAAVASSAMYYKIESEKPSSFAVATSGPGATTTFPTSMPAQVEKAMLGVGMCMGTGFVIAFPVFVLIWLGRETIREEIRTWGAASG